MSCPICVESYNRSTRQKIVCPSGACGQEACKQCVRQYLTDAVEDPHCMTCRIAWDDRFVETACNKSWFRGEYRTRRRELLWERERARLPEAMEHLERVAESERLTEQAEERRLKAQELRARIRELQTEEVALRQASDRVRDGEARPSHKRAFLMGCPRSDCRGYLNEDYSCKLCGLHTCPKCLTPKEADHECDEDALKTAALLRSSTKPCPGCGERIQKVDGCDQMWCLSCHTAFSWRTGAIDRGVVHNPEYFRYQREHGVILPRQPGDACGRDCDASRACDTVIRRLHAAVNSTQQRLSFEQGNRTVVAHGSVLRLVGHVRHVRHSELRDAQRRLRAASDTLGMRVDFLRGQIDEAELGRAAEAADRRRACATRQVNAWELLAAVGEGVLAALADDLAAIPLESSVSQVVDQLVAVTEQCFTRYQPAVDMANDALLLASSTATRSPWIGKFRVTERAPIALCRLCGQPSDHGLNFENDATTGGWVCTETGRRWGTVEVANYEVRSRDTRLQDRAGAAERHAIGIAEAP